MTLPRPLGRALFALVAAGCAGASSAREAAPPATFAPVEAPSHETDAPGVLITPGEEVANPFVYVEDDTYYLYSTQVDVYGEDLPVRVGHGSRTSFGPTRDVIDAPPAWTIPGFIWAPDVRRLYDGTYVAWYTAAAQPVNPPGVHATMCIGVSTATSPLGPFTPVGDDPAICQRDRLGSIDPRTFVDEDGSLWLHWKSDDNADLTGGHGTPSIYAQRLAPDGVTLLGSPTRILEVTQRWEGPIVEAPQLVRDDDGRYWLFYSGNWFNQPMYGLGVARCDGPAGPCRKPYRAPWLSSNSQGEGPGEASLFRDDDGWWLVYQPAAALDAGDTGRTVALAHVAFTDDGPVLVAPSDWPSD